MDKTQPEKPLVLPSKKSFMTVGPTLHYSHKNVLRYWLLAVLVFATSSLFWSKIVTGTFLSFSPTVIISPKLWYLNQQGISIAGIFEYPWQIFVLGLLMGILAIVPVLIAQLMSFNYSLPFILAVFFLANLPGFAICLLISCVAVACRPLRFRSRFIAVALCTAPQLIYWGCLGGASGVEPVKWGFFFTPWICAWLNGLAIAGLVLGIGHFTRYRPGLVWAVTFLVLLTAIIVFEVKIGFDELDYQLYIAKNNPEQISEFREHSITEALDETIKNPAVTRYLADFFYPTEPIPLRQELKKEIKEKLRFDRWPNWFMVSESMKYQAKKLWLFEQYDKFISIRFNSPRMPIALYYKALLSEYSPDIKALEQKEILCFYSDYPFERSLDIWHKLYREFGDSPESIGARWRIAKDWAAKRRFVQADKLLKEAQDMVTVRLNQSCEKKTVQNDAFFSPFRPPADSAITRSKLFEIQSRLNHLRNLISKENIGSSTASVRRLAKFVKLNPHAPDYVDYLDELLEQIGNEDPLADNVLLAQIKLIADDYLRAEELNKLHAKMGHTDGGMQALYELGLLKISMWRQQERPNSEQKKRYLGEARATLSRFLDMYPAVFCAEQARKILTDLPTAE